MPSNSTKEEPILEIYNNTCNQYKVIIEYSESYKTEHNVGLKGFGVNATTKIINNVKPPGFVILPNESRKENLGQFKNFLFSWKRFEEGAWIDLDENQPVKECKYIVINGPDKIEYLQVVLFLLYF